MNKMVKAKIVWLKYDQGGRSCPPPPGTHYCPIILFDNMQKDDEFWSADFVCTETNENLTSIVSLRLLSDHAPKDFLKENNKFQLYEGNKKVAAGIIVTT